MSLRRKHLGTDRETIADLLTVLTPIARRLATDKELRDELRSAADSVAGAYRKSRGDREPGRTVGRVYAHEEPSQDGSAAKAPVAAKVVDGDAVPRRRLVTSRALRVGLVAATGGAAALLAGRHARRGRSREV